MPVISSQTVSILAPHIFELVKGVFKTRKDKEPHDMPEEHTLDSLNREVLELQEVATKQGVAIGEIAQVMELKFNQLERQLKTQRLISIAAIAVAVVASVIAFVK